MPTRTRRKLIQLDFRSEETVIVTSNDEDRFVTTSSEAALACRQVEDSREWRRQWNEFLAFLHQWCKKHHGFVESGCVSVGDSGLNVLVCTHNEDYDFSIEDDLVKLDLSLAKRFPLCCADVMQIPNQRSLRSELSSESLLVYGDGKRSSASGGTQPVVS